MMRILLSITCAASLECFGAAAVIASQDALAVLEAAAKEAEAAGRTKEAFDLYVRVVQALPDPPPIDIDRRLRERLVRLAQELSPPPSDEAERAATGGRIEFQQSKDDAGFERAEALFRKAVRQAPWLPDMAYNLALVQEKLYEFEPAVANLNVYLVSNPADADTVRAKLRELEYLIERDREQVWIEWSIERKRETVSAEWILVNDRAMLRHPEFQSGFSDGHFRTDIISTLLTYESDKYVQSLPPDSSLKFKVTNSHRIEWPFKADAEERVRRNWTKAKAGFKKVTGETQTIAGLECTVHTFRFRRNSIIEACVAPGIRAPLAFLRTFTRLWGSEWPYVYAGAFPAIPWYPFGYDHWLVFDLLTPAEGFPISISWKNIPSFSDMSMTAKRVVKGSIPPSQLESAFKLSPP